MSDTLTELERYVHAVNTVASILAILFSETCLCNLHTAFTHLWVSLLLQQERPAHWVLQGIKWIDPCCCCASAHCHFRYYYFGEVKKLIVLFETTHRRNVFRGKLVGRVWDEQACLSHCTITHHHTLYSLHLRRRKVENLLIKKQTKSPSVCLFLYPWSDLKPQGASYQTWHTGTD